MTLSVVLLCCSRARSSNWKVSVT